MKFKNKIEKELNLPANELKIVMVEKSLKDTLNRIKNSELKSVTFEGGLEMKSKKALKEIAKRDARRFCN